MDLIINNRSKANILLFNSIDSTNTYLMNEGRNGAASWTVAIADHQTSGRGRLGRRFESEDSSGLYMSILIRDISKFDPTLLTVIAAVCVCEAVETYSDKVMSIKWVNDIYYDFKKVCGILTEGAFDNGVLQYAVVGIGLNIAEPRSGFPTEIQHIAGSVFEVYTSNLRDKIACSILEKFENYINNFCGDIIFEKYCSRSCIIGKNVTVTGHNEPFNATVVGINSDFSLNVKTYDGSEIFLKSGEISIKF